MYPKYFGLKEPSFSIAPDPHYLFLSEQHKEALAHLLYGAGEHGGFVLLTGEVGTGKTTVCRAFLEQLPAGVDVALIVNPAMTANELLLNICDEFRIPVAAGERSVKLLVDRLNDYLLAAHASGRRPVLMIDEAQNLRPKVLEQVRLLTNLETTKAKLLQIFLIGQPELRRMLEREGLRQINQRITARFHLRPLNARETGDYIRHRVAVAGVDRPLFTAAAVRRIHQIAGGVPRVVNILCDRALLGACVTRANQVTPGVVARAAREVRGEGIKTAPPPPVRPAFAAAAALALMLTAAWVTTERLRGDPLNLIADWFGPPPAAPDDPAPITAPGARVAARSATLKPDPGPQEPPATIDANRVLPAATTEGEPQIAAGSAGAPATPPTALIPSGVQSGAAAVTAPSVAPTVAASTPAADEPGALAVPGPAPVEAPSPPLPRVARAGLMPATAAHLLTRAALPEEAALRVLVRRWGISVQDLGSGDPCGRVAVFGLRCERERGKLSHVRFFDRPALLRIRDGGPERRYAVLGALDEFAGTLDLPEGSETIPIPELEAAWTGDYTVVWQPSPTGASEIGPRAAEESIRWLRQLLARVPGSQLTDTELGRFDPSLTAALREFQTARGLLPDGIAGPRTLVQLQNAVAMPDVPHLMTATLAAAAAAQAAAAVVSPVTP